MPAPRLRYREELPFSQAFIEGVIVKGHGLELGNRDVQEAVLPFVMLAKKAIECQDYRVQSIAFTTEGVRAEADAWGDILPWRVEVDFPPGYFADLMRKSEVGPSERTWTFASTEDQRFFDSLWDKAFSGHLPAERLTLRPDDFSRLQRIGFAFFDTCTQRALLKAGFYGNLYSDDLGSNPAAVACPIHVSSGVVEGTVVVTRDGHTDIHTL